MLFSFIKYVYVPLYLFVVLMVVVYGVHRYVLVALFLRSRRRQARPKGDLAEMPCVTVQLPIYNEAFVAERVIEAACEIEYPRELLEIQVLDDSIDDTTEIAAACVERMCAAGHDVKYLHRADRTGYKAGALQAGLKQARGEFVAVFDADFVPNRDILTRCLPHFSDESVGMVQARWGHLNRTDNLLTRGQAIFLDGHFLIEHSARNRTGRFMNFNGTAGVWRRKAIEEAGAWEHDTLTEDLDLSYRAQLAGWRFVYLSDVVCPAELPADINAFKSQQHRWTKGMVQTARKLLPRILSSRLPWRVKGEAFFHLTCSTVYLYVLLLSLAVLPNVWITYGEPGLLAGVPALVMVHVPLFILASMSASVFYIVSQREVRRDWPKTFLYLPWLMCLGIGLCVNNSKAVIEGLVGHDTPFIRTPKFGDRATGKRAKYRTRASLVPAFEIALGAYMILTIVACAYEGHLGPVPFLVLFAIGYLYVGLTSVIQTVRSARPEAAAA